jgi:hypothetical protein
VVEVLFVPRQIWAIFVDMLNMMYTVGPQSGQTLSSVLFTQVYSNFVVQMFPRLVESPILEDETMISVASGARHSAVLTGWCYNVV